MPQLLPSFLVLFSASGICAVLYLLHIPPRVMQQLVMVLLVLFIIFIYLAQSPAVKQLNFRKSKWFLLFFITLITQLFVLITGGIYSPFLILLHLYIIATSFFFPFYVPLLFLVAVVLGGVFQIYLDPQAMLLLRNDPVTVILYGITFIAIVPLARVVSHHYHLKSSLSSVLTEQLKVEEEILADIEELVLIVNKEGKILSLNDAVERVLSKSRSEIMQSVLSDVLLVKGEEGMIFKNLGLLQKSTAETFEDISLLTSSGAVKATMQVKPITDLQGREGQVRIILTLHSDRQAGATAPADILQDAVTTHDAMLEDLKNKLGEMEKHDLKNQAILIMKSSQDLHLMQEIGAGIRKKKGQVDLARLSRLTVVRESEYASIFRVALDFSYVNFGEEDIKPLLAGTAVVSPDQLTGPFFTAPCDVKYTGILLQKVLAIAVLVTPKSHDKVVRLSIEQVGQTEVKIKIVCQNSALAHINLPNLFTPYYGDLSGKTELHSGSGLEGAIAKSISDQLQIPLTVQLTENGKYLEFTISISKGEQTVASLALHHNS